ncbi:hypothetical protein MYX82_03805 [Acidobacteria bacterium AH-259-D05]|nr:hypothetical protein [Acidobacteria bacterium AH-259-D05]
MSPRKKRIKEMTPEEVKNLTDDEVIERIFESLILNPLHVELSRRA